MELAPLDKRSVWLPLVEENPLRRPPLTHLPTRLLRIILVCVSLVLVQSCSDDGDDALLTAPTQSNSGLPLEYVGHAYGQVDDQQALARWVVNQWQRSDGVAPERAGWVFDETSKTWVEESVSRTAEYWSREGESSEVRQEFSHRIEVTLTRGGVPQRDFATSDHMTVYHVIRTRYYALDPNFDIDDPFDYSSVGGYDAVLQRGRVLSLAGRGTIDGWQVREFDGERQDLHYDGEFSLEIEFALSGACPALRLESYIAITDPFGEVLDRYWSVADAQSDDTVLRRFLESEVGDGREMTERQRQCDPLP